jgi:hypothetical protein
MLMWSKLLTDEMTKDIETTRSEIKIWFDFITMTVFQLRNKMKEPITCIMVFTVFEIKKNLGMASYHGLLGLNMCVTLTYYCLETLGHRAWVQVAKKPPHFSKLNIVVILLFLSIGFLKHSSPWKFHLKLLLLDLDD